VEVLKLSGDAADDAQSVFLGSEANAMGLTTIDATAVAANDVLILNLAATSNALTINGGAAEDHITLGSGGSVVNSGDGIDVVVVGAANDGTFNDNITTGNGSNLVFVTHAQFSSHLVIDAGNGTDGLVMYDDGSVIDADFTNVVSLEQLYFSANAADNAQSVTLAAFAAAAGLNGVYAHLAGANDVITIDASGFANTLDIVTNDAADVITLGGGGSVVDARNGDNTVTVGADNDGVHDDNITTGNGADLIIASDAQLSNHLLIAAGGGVDTLRLTTDASVVDADLAQKTALEIIQLTANAGDDAQSVTLAANAMAAGVTTVDASLAASSDTVTVDASAYTQDLTVILHAGIDDVTLGSGNDVLLGGVSTGDIINLGAGNDSFAITTLAAVTIDGGIDLDSLVIGAGAGSRQIDFSNVVDQLSGLGTYLNFENLAAANANGQLSVIAGDGTTSIVTGSRIDQVDAGLADQGVTIATGASGDAIIGSAHNDSIDGGTGEDSIAGGAGNDALTGGTGSDTFVFDTALNAATNVDTLSDFVSGSDVFQLNLGIFAALESTDGVLNANNFIAGAGAVASNTSQRIILDTTSGSLFYDADGVGGVAQIEFARLGGAHTAVATDFVIG
jgi:Ca2+-binding RTX toxin-like protein